LDFSFQQLNLPALIPYFALQRIYTDGHKHQERVARTSVVEVRGSSDDCITNLEF